MTSTRISLGNGTSLAVSEVGQGKPVVLIPGFGLDHTIWDHTCRSLAASGYRAICIDPRGHGASDAPLDGYEVSELAGDLINALEELDLEGVALVGHSFGGQVAFSAAACGSPRVSSLALIGSNGVRATRSELFPFGAKAADILPELIVGETCNRLESRRENILRAFASPQSDLVADWLMRVSLQMPSWAAVECYRSMMEGDLVGAIGDVTIPVLQIIGNDDPVHSARGAEWLAEKLYDSTLVKIDRCGHYPMLEAPEQLDRVLIDFLARVDPAR